MKTAWYWHKNRDIDKWNRIEDLDINSHTYEQPIFDKEAKIIKWKKESIFKKCNFQIQYIGNVDLNVFILCFNT